MKYLLKQNKEDKGILCDKVTIDGLDYYVSDKQPVKGWYYDTFINKIRNTNKADYGENEITKQIIATNNPNIDIPKVVDEIERLFIDNYGIPLNNNAFIRKEGYISGYNKSQETHSNSDEDLKSLLDFITNEKSEYSIMYGNQTERFSTEDKDYSIEQLIEIWKEQQPKIVYYNE